MKAGRIQMAAWRQWREQRDASQDSGQVMSHEFQGEHSIEDWGLSPYQAQGFAFRSCLVEDLRIVRSCMGPPAQAKALSVAGIQMLLKAGRSKVNCKSRCIETTQIEMCED